MKMPIITARKRSLGQGNVFTPVCHSVHRGSAQPLPRCRPPQVQTPLGLGRPLDVDPSGCRLPHPGLGRPPGCRPPWMQTPWGWADPPSSQMQTPWMQTPRCWADPSLDAYPPPDTVNKRAVSILLGCLLVIESFAFTSSKLYLENPSSCWKL